eukprot:IDg10740t1
MESSVPNLSSLDVCNPHAHRRDFLILFTPFLCAVLESLREVTLLARSDDAFLVADVFSFRVRRLSLQDFGARVLHGMAGMVKLMICGYLHGGDICRDIFDIMLRPNGYSTNDWCWRAPLGSNLVENSLMAPSDVRSRLVLTLRKGLKHHRSSRMQTISSKIFTGTFVGVYVLI